MPESPLTQVIPVTMEDGTVVGHVTPFQMMQWRSALKLQANTGLKHSQGSVLNHVRQLGLTNKRTCAGAFKDLNKICVKHFGMNSLSL